MEVAVFLVRETCFSSRRARSCRLFGRHLAEIPAQSLDAFVQINVRDVFTQITPNDKVVDIACGKSYGDKQKNKYHKHILVVTQQGLLFARGNQARAVFHKSVVEESKDGESFMIKFVNRKKPDKVYKVKQIFSSQNLPCFWVNVTNRHGKMKTLGAGSDEFYLGTPVGKKA